MTNEEAKEFLIDISWELGFTAIEYRSCKDGEKMREAIKALEQQPFINKPCVSEGVCREDKIQVLEKIKAEINTMSCAITSMREIYINKDKIINILDKYKAESEDKE